MSILDKLTRIRGVTWEWKEEAAGLGKTPGETDAGVLAQDVEAVFPLLVATMPDGFKRVNYTGLIGVLVEAVKELKAKHEALERQVAALEKQLADARGGGDAGAGAPAGDEPPRP